MGLSYRTETVTSERWVVDTASALDAKEFNQLVTTANQYTASDTYDDAYYVEAKDDQIIITFREKVARECPLPY